MPQLHFLFIYLLLHRYINCHVQIELTLCMSCVMFQYSFFLTILTSYKPCFRDSTCSCNTISSLNLAAIDMTPVISLATVEEISP